MNTYGVGVWRRAAQRAAAAHLEPPERRFVRAEQEGEVRDLLAAVAAVQVDDVAAAARLERAWHAAAPVATEQREVQRRDAE